MNVLLQCFISTEIKSVATKNSENAQPITAQDLQYLRDDWQNKAEFYDERLINYLIDNREFILNIKKQVRIYTQRNQHILQAFICGQGSRLECWRDEYKYYK